MKVQGKRGHLLVFLPVMGLGGAERRDSIHLAGP